MSACRRAGHEADPRSLEVVIGVVQRVDLQLAAVAGAGVDVANAERTAEDGQELTLQSALVGRRLVEHRKRLAQHPGAKDVSQEIQHRSFTRRARCRRG
jgi:hypothetical protein